MHNEGVEKMRRNDAHLTLSLFCSSNNPYCVMRDDESNGQYRHVRLAENGTQIAMAAALSARRRWKTS